MKLLFLVSTRPEIELVGQGDFKWVSFQQYLLTQWKKYREQPYYCQFKTPGGYGRWMIACKPEVENVRWHLNLVVLMTGTWSSVKKLNKLKSIMYF